jgi:hypothetical protein
MGEPLPLAAIHDAVLAWHDVVDQEILLENEDDKFGER